MDILSLPPATRAYFIGCVATTALVHFDVVSPLYLYLNFHRVWSHGELWRLISNFFFFDYFSLNWLFHMLFLLPNAATLESNYYRGRASHFVWLIVVLAAAELWLSLLLFYTNLHRIMFLGPSFSFAVVYVWSRKSEHIQMNFLGLFVFQAPFLPVVLLGVGTLLGQSPVHDMVGLFAGHFYWYFTDVYPEIRPGRLLLKTPHFLELLFDPPPPPPVAAQPDAAADGAQNVRAAEAEEPREDNNGVAPLPGAPEPAANDAPGKEKTD